MENTIKILCYNTSDEELPFIQRWAKKKGVQVSHTAQPLTKETIQLSKDVDGICLSQMKTLDTELYSLLKACGISHIAQRSAGVDMYDLELAKQQGIVITNVPSYSPESIAEYTVAMTLQVLREIQEIRTRVQHQNFSWEQAIRGRVLGDLTVGIIGVGRIGTKAAQFFNGFGCRVLGYDKEPNQEIKDILEYCNSLEEIVSQADVLSLHLPLTKETKYLFDRELLTHCKKGMIFLNMARGGIVHTPSLLDALDAGQLSFCVLDTYELESDFVRKHLEGQIIEDKIFKTILNHPRIFYSPHIAYYTDKSVKEIVEQSLDATLEMITKGETEHIVNR